jgi:GxxExxY protein
MSADERGLKYEELTGAILKAFYEVFNELGQRFLESVYENALAIALGSEGLHVARQVPVPVWFRGKQVGDFRADLLVDSRVLLELKAGRAIEPVHEAQLMNYLRATDVEVGLLLNFGPKPQFKRLAYDSARKTRPNSNELNH